jgi:hypothetical protein
VTATVFLTRVVLRNYKSIATSNVALGPLTYLVGANGSGKINLVLFVPTLERLGKYSCDVHQPREPVGWANEGGPTFSGLRGSPRWASFLSPTYTEFLPILWSVGARGTARPTGQ